MITLLLFDVPFLKKLTNKKTCNSSFFPQQVGKGDLQQGSLHGRIGQCH